MGLDHGNGRMIADHRPPWANPPGPDEAVEHVGVGAGKALGRFGALSFEKENRLIHRIFQRSGEHEFATRVGFARKPQVVLPIGGSPL